MDGVVKFFTEGRRDSDLQSVGSFVIERYRHSGYFHPMSRFFNTRPLRLAEFIPLVALVTALDALSIDTIIPALPAIAADLGVAGGNDMQLLISVLFAGFACGQLVGGPMADAWGRKPAIYFGLALYIAGSLLGLVATSFPMLLAARFLQGMGASIPFTGINAMVRDLYSGAPMARIMSFIGAVFIMVPMLAPLAGQGILLVATWREIFLLYLVLAVPAAIWFGLRQPETLARENRAPMSLAHIARTTVEVFRIRRAAGYIICGGFLTGSFLGYLNSAQQIYQETYGLGTSFVFYFSALAFSLGLSMLINGTLVERIGMRQADVFGAGRHCRRRRAVSAGCCCLFGCATLVGGHGLSVCDLHVCRHHFRQSQCAGHGALGPHRRNWSCGHRFVSSMMGAVLGGLIGRAYDGGITALVAGFAVLNILALAAMRWGERGADKERLLQSMAVIPVERGE